MAALTQAKTVQFADMDTAVTLEAGATAPRFLRIAARGMPAWENRSFAALVDHVEMNGARTPVQWKLKSIDKVAPTQVQFVYDSINPRLRLVWEWRARALNGPIEHSIRIQNLTGAELWLPLQNSFQFDFRIESKQPLKQLWIEKGAGSPSGEGTHYVALQEGDRWTGTSSTYAHPSKGEPREMIPFLLVERPDAAESGWYAGIEFSGRTRMTLTRHQDSLTGEFGLNSDPGPYRTRLTPGEVFETPTVFLGAFSGGPDAAGNILRHWIRNTLNNPVTIKNPTYPMLVSNSWGSGMAINAAQAHKMIEDASGLGMEMFHLDAGWFRGVGDWVSDASKFPDGVSDVASYAHRMGLKFGLWTDWTQAGVSTGAEALNVSDPNRKDWLTVTPPPGWKPKEFRGITIDLGVPAAMQWAAATVAKLVSGFHLDMLEHDGYLVAQGCERQDHPHAPLEMGRAKRYLDEDYLWVEGANDTDVSYRATRGYYEVQASLRRQFPALLLEICNDGGRMVDFGSAAHGDYFSITDAYDPVSNRRAFFDASHVLPPAMLETYVEKWQAPHLENFRYMLRSGMMGWFSLMQDSASWTPAQRDAARAEFALYKSRLRPLIREADLYHVSERPDGVHWDGMEYFNSASNHGALFAFHGSSQVESSHTFQLRGLRNKANYNVMFHDRTSAPYTTTGEQLMRTGVTVRESVPNSSEIVFFEPI